MKTKRSAVAACILTVFLGSNLASGQEITFRKIVDSNTPIPGKAGNFSGIGAFGGAADINNGLVVFSASNGLNRTTGVYISDGQTISVVADESVSFPGNEGNGFMSHFSPQPSIDQGVVAFESTIRGCSFPCVGPRIGVFTSTNGQIATVVNNNSTLPSGEAVFGTIPDGPSSSNGELAFTSFVNSDPPKFGLYSSAGGVLSTIADLNTAIPGGTGNFCMQAPKAISRHSIDDGDIAFIGGCSDTGQSGVYTNLGGGLRRVADLNTPIPNGSVNFDFFFKVVVRNENVYFIGGNTGASSASRTGIYVDNNNGGPPEVVIDNTVPIPGTGRNYNGANDIAVDNNGDLAFRGGTRPDDAIFVLRGSELIRIVGIGDSLDEKEVVGLRLGGSTVQDVGFNDGQIAFYVGFTDGTEAIYVACLSENCLNGPGDPSEGLVSYWSFDDGTANDQVGTNDGIIFGGAAFTGGGADAAPIPNNLDALRLDGIASEVLVLDDPSLDFPESRDQTLAMWFKHESARGIYHLLGKRDACQTMNYQLARDSRLLSLNTTSGGVFVAGIDAVRDRWAHLATTYDASTQTARIYVDGVLRNTDTTYMVGPVVAADLLMGNSGGCPNSQRFVGVIDEVRIYDRVLIPEEVAALATSPFQNIVVAPLEIDFGQVDAFTTASAIVTISNTGTAGLEISDIAITEGGEDFEVVDIDPPADFPFVVPAGTDVFVTVSMFPTSEGLFEGTMTVSSDDPDDPAVDVSLIGNGLSGAVDDQATALEAAVAEAIEAGTLVGSGSGNSAAGRLGAFEDMVEAAGDLIEAGLIDDACGQLRSAMQRVDGVRPPPDFVEGEGASLIVDQISFLRDSLGCG